jgi:hypothetical protein
MSVETAATIPLRIAVACDSTDDGMVPSSDCQCRLHFTQRKIEERRVLHAGWSKGEDLRV